MHLSLKKKKEWLSKADQAEVVAAIQRAEKETSGEIRVFIESKCKYVAAIERAKEIFFRLRMEQTKLRNGVIIYVALQDKQSAILGDQGIYNVTGGHQFWDDILKEMNAAFKEGATAKGLGLAIHKIGRALSLHFPYDAATDKNELPDDIVFGK